MRNQQNRHGRSSRVSTRGFPSSSGTVAKPSSSLYLLCRGLCGKRVVASQNDVISVLVFIRMMMMIVKIQRNKKILVTSIQ